MKAPTQSDIHPLAPPWIRRVSVLCLLACLPFTGCGDKDPAGEDDDVESSQDEAEGSEQDSKEGSEEGSEESQPEESEPEESEDNESEEPDEEDSEEKDSEGEDDDNESEKSDAGDEEDDEDDEDSDTGEDEPDPEGEPEKPKRDCEQISWGSATLAAGQVIARGDVTGYVDSNGDDKPEATDAPAGMCELHLTDKRCGLIVFGQGRSSG